MRAHDDPLARCRGRERRNDVRDRLADARPRLGDERSPFLERPLDRGRELTLLRPVLVSLEHRGERATRRERAVDRDGRRRVSGRRCCSSFVRVREAASRVVRPHIFHDRVRRIAEELGRCRTHQLGEGRDLAQDERWQRAREPRKVREHERGGDRVIERPVCGVGDDRGVRGEPLEGVARRRWKKDRGKLGGVEAIDPRWHSKALEEGDVETDVVPDQTGGAITERERGERGHHIARWRRANEVSIGDPGQT